MTAAPVKPSNQFALLGQRRFGPFFLSQFLSAGNDNLLKFALTLLVSSGWLVSDLPAPWVGPLIGLVFLVPFMLSSLVMGPWLDAQDKGRLLRRLKVFEVLIMALAAWGLWWMQLWPLLISVMGLGVYGACLGPVKWAYMPGVLRTRELMGANGIVTAGTFTAIWLGHVGGVVLMGHGTQAARWVGLVCVAVAVLGWLVSLGIPVDPPLARARSWSFNPMTELPRTVAAAKRDPSVFQAVVALGWTWFMGAFYLSQVPMLTRDILGAGPGVGALLLAVFTIGLLLASVFAEMMSRQNVEVGLMLIGAMCIGSYGGDLYFSTGGWPAPSGRSALDVSAFLDHEGSRRVMYDLFRLALALGFFCMPLYAFIQWRARPEECARIMVLGNVINAVFLMAGCVVSAAFLWMGLSLPQLFIAGAVVNGLAVLYIFKTMPEALVRLTVMAVTRFFYFIRIRGDEPWPMQGAAVMVCNHVSLVDAMIVAMLSPRPVLVLVDPKAMRAKGFAWYYRRIGAVPLVPKDVDAAAHQQAIDRARQALDDGQLVCVFPEGQMTPDGQLQPFMDVVPAIVQQRPVPVFPTALHNMWGSSFSHIHGEPMRKILRRGIYNRVGLVMAPALSASEATTERLQAEVARLLSEPRP